ncbi:helix-turn-helix transcriptional regulator [Rufibacter ruber]|uniref:helix-turn-helix transcriptional regulator n=1 Tax=Rufibacter ruber TaxID=1783499 RepID=UPI000830258B|nr:helix-turn-helix domain-containing protein [Rufibacter ruber]
MEDYSTIDQRLKKIEDLLLTQKPVLTFDEVASYTGLSKSYLYKLTSRNDIPFYRPNGKQLYFNRQEIDAWLQRNRVKTNFEIDLEASTKATLQKTKRL